MTRMTIYYVITNEAMPGLVKIGKTNRSIKERLEALSSPSSVPGPFVCEYAVQVSDDDQKDYEKLAHAALRELRYNNNREFFQIPLNDAISLMKMIPGTPLDLSPQSADPDSSSPKFRPPFQFPIIGLKPGDHLTFRTDESIIAVVFDDKKIKYKGEITSLTGAAKEILGKSTSISGPKYWKYRGEILDDIRTRMEQQPENRERLMQRDLQDNQNPPIDINKIIYFMILLDENAFYFWEARNINHEYIARSEPYDGKQDCLGSLRHYKKLNNLSGIPVFDEAHGLDVQQSSSIITIHNYDYGYRWFWVLHTPGDHVNVSSCDNLSEESCRERIKRLQKAGSLPQCPVMLSDSQLSEENFKNRPICDEDM